MKNGFRPSKRVPVDPLERAEENARAYQDLAKAEARRLPDYESSDEESTARHDVPVIHNHVHVSQESIHESEPPAKKQLKAGLIALGSGVGLAVMTGLLALLQRCSH